MSYIEKYNEWVAFSDLNAGLKKELLEIAGNDKEIEERFHKSLDFGTAGLRGIIGAGTNRMNIYTVGQATQGLAEYIKKNGDSNKGVVIAFDSRIMSPEFALEAAKVLCANKIKVYIFLFISTFTDSG